MAAQDVVRAMVDHVAMRYGLSPEDAYMLRSLVVDLKISEIVDTGQWYIVSAVARGGVLGLHTNDLAAVALPRSRPRPGFLVGEILEVVAVFAAGPASLNVSSARAITGLICRQRAVTG